MTSEHVQAFQKFLQPQQISADSALLQTYGKDWTTKYTANAGLVLFPQTTEEVSQILKYCQQQKLGVVTSGGRTGLSGGAVALNKEVVISLDKMNRILEIDPYTATAHVEAGVVTQVLQEKAREQGLFFPIDFASKGTSQLGGNVATNAGGVNVVAYGMIRDNVLGLKAVLADGTILDLTRKLYKNNCGYDLKQLFIGSEGTLGVITEVIFRLKNPPAPGLVMLGAFANLENVLQLLAKLRRQSWALQAFEFFDRTSLNEVLKEMPRLKDPFSTQYPFYALVEVQNIYPQLRDEVLEWMSEYMENNMLLDMVVSESSQAAADLWALRENISESLSIKCKPHKNDVSVPINRIAEFIVEYDLAVKKLNPQINIAYFGHIADGNIHINVLKPESEKLEAFNQFCLQHIDPMLFGLLKKYQGSHSAEHGIGLLKKQGLSVIFSAEQLQWQKKVKDLFDPQNILNPGKLF